MKADETVTRCGCQIIGPMALGAILAEGVIVRHINGSGVYQAKHCPTHAAAPELRDYVAQIRAWLVAPDLSPDTLAEFQANARALLARIEALP